MSAENTTIYITENSPPNQAMIPSENVCVRAILSSIELNETFKSLKLWYHIYIHFSIHMMDWSSTLDADLRN